MLSSDDLSKIADQIIRAAGNPQTFELSADQFREVYRLIRGRGLSPRVDIVLNGEIAVAQFTSLCNHRILVMPNSPSNMIQRIFRRRSLEESDFAFDVMLNPSFHGQRKRSTFLGFIKEEVESNWRLLLIVVVICILVFSQLGSPEVYLVVNQAISASATLFVTIFLLFSVSQNATLIRDLKSFDTGQLHRWFAIDRYVALIAIASLVTAIITQAFLTAGAAVQPSTSMLRFATLDLVPTAGFLTIVAILLLADCFVAITEYYFQRIKAVIFRDLTADLLDKAMDLEEKAGECQRRYNSVPKTPK